MRWVCFLSDCFSDFWVLHASSVKKLKYGPNSDRELKFCWKKSQKDKFSDFFKFVNKKRFCVRDINDSKTNTDFVPSPFVEWHPYELYKVLYTGGTVGVLYTIKSAIMGR